MSVTSSVLLALSIWFQDLTVKVRLTTLFGVKFIVYFSTPLRSPIWIIGIGQLDQIHPFVVQYIWSSSSFSLLTQSHSSYFRNLAHLASGHSFQLDCLHIFYTALVFLMM